MLFSVILVYHKLSNAQEKDIYSSVSLREEIIDVGRGIGTAINRTELKAQTHALLLTHTCFPSHQHN